MVQYIEKSLYSKNRNYYHDHQSRPPPKKGFFATKFVEFCKRTDLHGYKYIVMEDLTVFERSCWALAVLVSTAFAAFFVVTAYRWFARNPIVTVSPTIKSEKEAIPAYQVIESTQGAIWDIPFPAVTLCNLNVISRKAARDFADRVTLPVNVTADDVYDALRYAPLLHSTFAVDQDQVEKLFMLQSVLELNNISIESLFKDMSPTSSCSQLVQRCMWKNTIYRCDTLFQPIFTFFALCCSFNYFAIDNGKKKMASEMARDQVDMPRRVASCGYQTALTVLLNTHPEDYYSAIVASQGILVFIENAYNLADVDSPVRLVNPGTEVLVALSPERTYTTPGIRAFSPKDRQCYYSDEVKMGNFRKYSFHNCMAYQRIEYIRTICDCVPYYFSLKDYYRTCNFNDIECLSSFLGPKNRTHLNAMRGSFECLPECEHYDYPLEVALGKLARHVRLDGLPFFNDVNLGNSSLVNVFFNDLVSTRYRRDVYLNWQNLLASFGGLLSLMLGFTLISGFDLILFLTFGMAYGFLTNDSSVSSSKIKKKLTKSNQIHVQEFSRKPENYVKKDEQRKDLSKLYSEIGFINHNRY